MKDEPISFETAKLAKEKGFTFFKRMGYTTSFYHPKTRSILRLGRTGRCKLEDLYYRSTQNLLQKWLREEFRIDVLPTMSKNSRTYGYRILCIEDGKTIEYVHIYEKHETYEEALEFGLMEGLKLIK